MPAWMQEIIHNYPNLAPLAPVLGLCVTCYTVFAFVEDRLSVSAKQEITAWLKSTGDFAANQALSFNLLRFHSKLFGDKQLSIKCLMRTTLFSLTSFLLVFLPYIIIFSIYIPRLPLIAKANKFFGGDIYTAVEKLFFVTFILFVLPLDFLGVAVTRKLASLAGNNVSLTKVAFIFISATMHLTNNEPIRNETLVASASLDAAGAPANKIEVTPEMIEAGLPYLFKVHRDRGNDEELIAEIYRAMTRARCFHPLDRG